MDKFEENCTEINKFDFFLIFSVKINIKKKLFRVRVNQNVKPRPDKEHRFYNYQMNRKITIIVSINSNIVIKNT